MDALFRKKDQIDRTVESGIIEEIELGSGDARAVFQCLDGAARKAALIELVVGFDAQVIDFPFSYIICDITQNRQEAAFVFRDFFTIDIDAAAVSDTAETQLTVSVKQRYEEVSFIPGTTTVIL